jgi:hypothetical protein
MEFPALVFVLVDVGGFVDDNDGGVGVGGG